MKAMIFAAGLGTRLRPLTNDRPKALVEINGVPLLEIAIRRLIAAGCNSLIINVHHFADLVIDFLKKINLSGVEIAISDERDLLLDTGGGLKKARWFFDDGQPFLLCNADVLTNLDLAKFYQAHCDSKALATLAVRNRPSSRCFLFDEKMQLSGWENTVSSLQWAVGSPHPTANCQLPITQCRLAFSGIHAISPRIFDWMSADKEVFSIIETYLAAAAKEVILGYVHDEDFWFDVGKPETLALAAAHYQAM